MARPPATQIVPAEFARPSDGPSYVGEAMDLPLTGKVAWSSNGGTGRGHPARTNPYTLEAALPPGLVRIHIVGLLARFADTAHEALGTPGASLQIFDGLTLVFRQDLLNGRHYGDPKGDPIERRLNGDGTSLESVGSVEVDDEPYRVDLL
ncbi:hypothetical protein EON79_10460, partial [bacterium]